ncbi:MAG: UDP-N-acetyl-D-glucosamine dehydrogenase, partial [Planctomycetes bacterium]|nr:UDP-N-acetyl-D-glucosamine dehydrogenase [Planctomycetota bacterium]
GAQHLTFNDPHVNEVHLNGTVMASQELTDKLISQVDCVIITTDHSKYDFENIVKHANLIIDTRNATKSVQNAGGKIIRLGSSGKTT